VPVADVSRFNDSLREFLSREHADIGAEIAASKDLSAVAEAKLRGAIAAFKESWSVDGVPL
jgi:F0F1-type ATP synthase alpha subunit